MYSWKRISQNSFPKISFIYFQSPSWYSVRNYKIPKGIMKTRFEPRLPRMTSWKNNKLHTLDLNLGPPVSEAKYLSLDHQSCLCQDHSWGNKAAKPIKVTGKNGIPWLFWIIFEISNFLYRSILFPNLNYKKNCWKCILLFWNSYVGFWTEVWLISFGIM